MARLLFGALCVTMIASDTEVHSSVDYILSVSDPVSVFLYGSRARGDYLDNSDYEIAAVYKSDCPGAYEIKLPEEQACVLENKVSVFSFLLDDLAGHCVPSPFETSLFLNELWDTGSSIYGTSVRDMFTAPDITVENILSECHIISGRTLAGRDACCFGDIATAEKQAQSVSRLLMRVWTLTEHGVLFHRSVDLVRYCTAMFSKFENIRKLTSGSGSTDDIYEGLFSVFKTLDKELRPRLADLGVCTVVHTRCETD